jgi:hypothetical protein
VYTVEIHASVLRAGPAVVFSALLPDFDHFKGSEGGRTLPLVHPDGTPNITPGLTAALTSALGIPITGDDVLAYVAGISSHPGFREVFENELATPGVRIPFTSDAALWARAVELGREVLWIHTYGHFPVPGRSAGDISFPPGDDRRVLNLVAVSALPTGLDYDEAAQQIVLGGGRFGPVTKAMFEYEVGGRNVLKSWVAYRSKDSAGKRTSALDDIEATHWEHAWTGELNELLTALRRLTELESAQEDALLDIMSGASLLGMDTLAAAGVRFPKADADRKPRYPAEGGLFDGML